jgi:hypothetical protein
MPQIILSYRRADSAAMTRLIFDRLIPRYGANSVFMDIDNIPFGTDFRTHIRESLLASDVLLAVVGSRWTGQSAAGPSRIQEEDDPVRVEVETSLQAELAIIPIVIEGAKMPEEAELPDSLKAFRYLNAVEMSSGRDFSHHFERLVRAIDKVLIARGKPPSRKANPPGFAGTLAAYAGNASIWVALAAACLPVAAAFVGVSPPWPRGVTLITAVMIIIMMITFCSLLNDTPRRILALATTASLVALMLLTPAYLASLSLFTYETPTTKEHWAKGYVCTDEATLLYKDKCPNLGVDELREAEFEAERLWTTQSITVVRLGLDLLWVGAFGALSMAMATIFVRERRAGHSK